MVLNGVQYLHSSRLKCPSKEWILSAGNANDMLCYFFHINGYMYSCLFFVRLKIQMRKENQNGSNGSMITWDDFGCRSDVVQMSFRMSFRSPLGFKNLTYCSVTDLSTQIVFQIKWNQICHLTS